MDPRATFNFLMLPGKPFHDCPMKDRFLFQMDGGQAKLGPTFKPLYYSAMDLAFQYIIKLMEKADITAEGVELTVKDVLALHAAALPNRDEFGATVANNGFRDGTPIFFQFCFPGTDEKEQAESSLSENGVIEFCEEYFSAQKSHSEDKEAAYWRIASKPAIGEGFNFIEETFQSKDDIVQTLMLDVSHGNPFFKTEEEKRGTSGKAYYVEGCAASSEKIAQLVQRKLNEFYAFVKKCREEKHSGDEAIILKLVETIRSLHQHHCFADGNGRTFIFLLQNVLLYQATKKWAIIETPCHFAAYSKAELKNEVFDGIKKFEDCKITKAKKFILEQKGFPQTDKEARETFKEKLTACLSTEPVVALAQINELYLQIDSKQISFPDNSEAKNTIISLLHELYVHQMLRIASDEAALKVGNEYIQHVLENHEIISHNQQVKFLLAYMRCTSVFDEPVQTTAAIIAALNSMLKNISDGVLKQGQDFLVGIAGKLQESWISGSIYNGKIEHFKKFRDILRNIASFVQSIPSEKRSEKAAKLLISHQSDFIRYGELVSIAANHALASECFREALMIATVNEMKNTEKLKRDYQGVLISLKKSDPDFTKNFIKLFSDDLRRYKNLDDVKNKIDDIVSTEPVAALSEINQLFWRLNQGIIKFLPGSDPQLTTAVSAYLLDLYDKKVEAMFAHQELYAPGFDFAKEHALSYYAIESFRAKKAASQVAEAVEAQSPTIAEIKLTQQDEKDSTTASSVIKQPHDKVGRVNWFFSVVERVIDTCRHYKKETHDSSNSSKFFNRSSESSEVTKSNHEKKHTR